MGCKWSVVRIVANWVDGLVKGFLKWEFGMRNAECGKKKRRQRVDGDRKKVKGVGQWA